MATSPAQRSLKHLRDLGYTVAVTEKWNPHARVRQDLFGFIDLLAIKDGETLAIQTTSSSSFSERKKKIEGHVNLPLVLAAGWQVSVHGWRKNAKGKWVLRESEIGNEI
ncbi:MAG TPA: hypothetical protein PL131_11315 [Methylotenera sp.]|nr:hypothetical protein [Methylotenera sp.]HPH06456.1 hypothetical protein [Methylotenera sp.]HPN00397.1 hypothetical protein [Methylotenera sp.]